MISLTINFALFFLVLFLVVPGMMILVKFISDYIHQNRKHVGYDKDGAGKLAG
jgi:hypothetical protein